MSHVTYNRLDKHINQTIVNVSQDCLNKTVEKVKAAHTVPLFADEQTEWGTDDGIISIDVSFDGTLHKRGFTSHYGVGIVIDILTDMIYYEVMSTYCHTCNVNGQKLDNMSDQEQIEWYEDHQKNHHGSAKSMEADAAVKIWKW